jgi:hypothetical protein
VESGVRTFGWSYEAAMRRWSNAAHTILDFDRNNKSSQSRYLIVRYEDLFTNPEKEMSEILAFLSLNTATYDFDAATNLPIRGSSRYRRGDEAVHWKPIEKTKDFNPLLRWSRWNQALHERFNWIAGEYLVQFGYEKKQFTTNRRVWAMWNKTMDINWRAKTLGEAARRRVFRKRQS